MVAAKGEKVDTVRGEGGGKKEKSHVLEPHGERAMYDDDKTPPPSGEGGKANVVVVPHTF